MSKREIINAIIAGYNAKLSGYHVIDIKNLPCDDDDLKKILSRAELIQEVQRAGGHSFNSLNKKKTKEIAEIWKKTYNRSKLPTINEVLESQKNVLGIGSRRSPSPKKKTNTTKKEPKGIKRTKTQKLGTQCSSIVKRAPSKKTKLKKENVEKCCKKSGWKKSEVLQLINEHNERKHRPKIKGRYGKTSKKSIDELCDIIKKNLKY